MTPPLEQYGTKMKTNHKLQDFTENGHMAETDQKKIKKYKSKN